MIKALAASILFSTVFHCVYAQAAFPLRISDDHRHLVDRKNKPFPILGRTAWCILSQPEKAYRKFVENTLAHGHNAFRSR
ncbi:MAG TPA: hypothetical protein PKM27_05095 [Saprospiraceae bacterium]|nr:hypothetical protein [Saprospiraceae bacterium]HNT20769.1 hypothetical protein [Saprospiraceae bacterium]